MTAIVNIRDGGAVEEWLVIYPDGRFLRCGPEACDEEGALASPG
jgi:hypothetical protein